MRKREAQRSSSGQSFAMGHPVSEDDHDNDDDGDYDDEEKEGQEYDEQVRDTRCFCCFCVVLLSSQQMRRSLVTQSLDLRLFF